MTHVRAKECTIRITEQGLRMALGYLVTPWVTEEVIDRAKKLGHVETTYEVIEDGDIELAPSQGPYR